MRELSHKRVVFSCQLNLGRGGRAWIELRRRDDVPASWPWFERWRQCGVRFFRAGRLEVTHAPARLARLVQSPRKGSPLGGAAETVEERRLPV